MKRKISLLSMFVILLITFWGCGKSPQEKYLEFYGSMQNQEFSSMKYDMSISDLDFIESSDATEQMTATMVATQIKDAKIQGKLVQDKKNKKLNEMTLNVSAMGLEVPLTMIFDDKDIFMSTDVVSSILELASNFNADIPAIDTSELTGKFLDINELADSEALNSEVTDEVEVAKLTRLSQKFYKEYGDKITEYLKKKDAKLFTEKDGVISYTFTQEDFKELVKIANTLAKENKDYKDFAIDESALEVFEEIKMSVKTNVNIDKKQMKSIITLEPNDSTEAGFKKIGLKFDVTYGDDSKEIKIPSKDQLVTQEQINEIFTSGSQVTETQFQELKDELEPYKGQLSEDEIKEILTIYESILTEEQIKELSDFLK